MYTRGFLGEADPPMLRNPVTFSSLALCASLWLVGCQTDPVAPIQAEESSDETQAESTKVAARPAPTNSVPTNPAHTNSAEAAALTKGPVNPAVAPQPDEAEPLPAAKQPAATTAVRASAAQRKPCNFEHEDCVTTRPDLQGIVARE